MKLAILLSTYNGMNYLEEQVDSIIAQTYTDWKLYIRDDASTDATVALIKRLADGAQTCRNIGLEMARGEFVIVFDSDDYIAPYCLRQRVEMLQKRPDLDFLVFPSGVFVDDRFIAEPHPYAFGFRVAEDDVALFASRRLPFIVWNNIYRTESLRRHNLTWDDNLLSLQDADFNI